MKKCDLLTSEQQEMIVNTIVHKCRRHFSQKQHYQDISDSPYNNMRVKSSVTASVLSGFKPSDKIPNITIEIINYGANNQMAQPELKNSKAIFHIYSKNCGFTADIYKDHCSQYNNDLDSFPVFCCIVFDSTNEGLLNEITLQVPNSKGKFIEHFLLHKRDKSEIRIA